MNKEEQVKEIKEQEGYCIVDHEGVLRFNSYSSDAIMSELLYKEKLTFRQIMDNKPYLCIKVRITPIKE